MGRAICQAFAVGRQKADAGATVQRRSGDPATQPESRVTLVNDVERPWRTGEAFQVLRFFDFTDTQNTVPSYSRRAASNSPGVFFSGRVLE